MDIISPKLASLGGVKALFYTSLVTLLIGCGGSGGSGEGSGANNGEQGSEENPSFTIGGTISGLSESASLILQNNAGDDLSITANGNFSFSTALNELEAYTVSVLTQPSNPNQICNITNANGNLANENISNIDISCTTIQYRINGTVSGLTNTESLTLQNNAGDDLTISVNGNFTFATAFDHLAPYHITVSTQSMTADRNCAISNPSGSLTPTSIINIVCANNLHTVGGTMSGFSEIGNLVLQNNAGDNLTITSNGSFTFPTALIKSDAYMVSVMTQPSNPNQTCNITDGNGHLGNEDITNINIACTTTQYTVSGTVSGLANFGDLILYNNASDGLKISSNGNFNFATPLDHLSNYNITVSNQPTYADQTCVIENPTGKLTPTSNINITCTSNQHSVGGTVSGFSETGSLVLQNNGGDDLTITTNGSFNFPTNLIKSDTYAVSVLTQPNNPNQTCLVENPSGSIAKEDISNINITCTARRYSIGGTVSGLTGTGLILQNNSSDDLAINSNGTFTFETLVDNSTAFTVSILNASSPAQPCRILNGQGIIAAANNASVVITCSPDFYVSIGDINATDNGTGTQAEPFITIKAAIDFTSTFSGSINLKVAQGNYDVNSELSTEVVMVEGISIYGGYNPQNWDQRNPTNYPSIITDTNNAAIGRTIYAGTGITAATEINGFTINGAPTTSYSNAIEISDSSPTISDNIINAHGSGSTSAIKNSAGSPNIFGNTINGGGSGNVSYGIFNLNAASAVIYNNDITGGDGNSVRSYGIYNAPRVSAIIYNNTINGGDSITISYGILNGTATAEIYNNTISGGGGPTTHYAYAIKLRDGATATINNNILFTEGGLYRYCLLENGGTIENNATVFNNNNLFNCPTALYKDTFRSSESSNITDLEADINNQGFMASGNTNLDPNFIDITASDWHLSNSTPCEISQAGQNGSTLSWPFNNDNEGTVRTSDGTKKWSMGAYEHDSGCKTLTPLYVSISNANATDAGSGSKDFPFLTINAAIDYAVSESLQIDIWVAGGNYNVDSSLSSEIIMKEGVSIYGGYNPSNWNERDPTSYTSTITDLGNGPYGRAVKFNAGITNVTVINGFTINGGPAENYSYTIEITNASPTISGNIINAYSGGSYSMGISSNTSGSPLIFNNTIHGGGGSNFSAGISSGYTSPIIYNNYIDGGSSNGWSMGISNGSGVSATIYNNTISGGSTGSFSHGIMNESSTATIYNNTISGGTGGSFTYAIRFRGNATASIQNNILFTQGGLYRHCIYEDNATGDTTALNNNNFFDCPTALYRDGDDSINLLNITEIENDLINEGFTASGNTNLNPNFVNAATNDWHLTSTTPCAISKGGQDGDALSWLFSDDIESTLRTGNGSTNWSMGAYEHNATCL